MRKRSLNTIHKLAQKNPKIVFVGSDLGIGTAEDFRKEFPDRFFMEGISEGHLIGMCAGMAMSGKIVYFNTIATFLTRRCFEQNIVDLGLGNVNVRLIGNGGGLVYAPLGPTHLAFEDVSIMRAIPNMTTVVPCDADEMERAIIASESWEGPIYFRVAKGGDPIVSSDNIEFKIGRANILKEGNDALIIANGVMVERALSASKVLENDGISTTVINAHTVKPFDDETVIDQIKKVRAVVTLEEALINGGLGSTVAEIISENDLGQNTSFKRLGIPDHYPDKYGSQNQLIAGYGLDPENVSLTVKSLLEKRTQPIGISNQESTAFLS